MIDERFDGLARAMARGVSRRAGLGILAGAGLAMLPLGRKHASGLAAQPVNLNQTGWGFSPGEPCVNRSGLARAKASRSASVAIFDSVRTTTTSGALTTMETAAKSARGS